MMTNRTDLAGQGVSQSVWPTNVDGLVLSYRIAPTSQRVQGCTCTGLSIATSKRLDHTLSGGAFSSIS